MCTYNLAECGVIGVDVAQDMLRILYIIYGCGGKDKKIPFVYTLTNGIALMNVKIA